MKAINHMRRIHRRYLSTILKSGDERKKVITQRWLDSIVIKEKLCPFAPPVSREPQLRICISHGTNHDEIVREIESEAHLLVGNRDEHKIDLNDKKDDETGMEVIEKPETTLVVLDAEKCPSLSDFRDLVHLSWRVQDESIVQHGYEKDLQIVLFHPLAKHDTYADEQLQPDAADYTIRSPFPIIHLLREEDVLKAVTSGYKDLEGLPSRNKAKLRSLGLDVCKERLEACWKQ